MKHYRVLEMTHCDNNDAANKSSEQAGGQAVCHQRINERVRPEYEKTFRNLGWGKDYSVPLISGPASTKIIAERSGDDQISEGRRS